MAYGLLSGKRGIIFGALDESSIAWEVAEQVHAEGGKFVLSNAPIALRMGALNALGEKTGSPIIAADATSVEDLEKLIDEAQAHLGGKLDFILHSIGMSPNVRKKRHYGEMKYDDFLKTMDISAISFHKIMQVAEQKDALAEWGSIVGLSYIAAQRAFPDYCDMAQAKAALESIARSYGYRLGKMKNVRVNTISQSPTVTTAGKGITGFNAFMQFAEMMSPLGNATAEDCANLCVMLFSDLTRRFTMQNLMSDGGFSSTGITEEMIAMIEKSNS